MALPPRHILSKSTFMHGCQCTKRLWLHKFQPQVRDEETEAQAAIFQSGTDVGFLARQLFSGGLDASPPTYYQYQQSVADTAKYIRKGIMVIYEAAFQFDGIMAAIDILVQKKGKWYAFEVKASTSVKPAYILDAALQYYVITQSGLPLEDISIIHLNRDYIRKGELDIQKLFTCVSIIEAVKEQQAFIIDKSAELKSVLKLKQPPDVSIGEQCFKPYDCDFFGFCSKALPEEEMEQEVAYINHTEIKKFLSQLTYPLHFMDFETWMTAVPEQDGHWPFRQIPFQFSMHIQENAGDNLEHLSYLTEGTYSSSLEFAESLLKTIRKKGSIVVYNQTFENMILNNLKDEFPQLAAHIEKIQKRIVDLMSPFRKNYRLPEMQWSYSIKYVLPALVPELSYDSLVIGNGGDASAAFYNLKQVENETEKQATRQALLEYCKLDTLAMAKILEKLILVK